MGASSTAGPGTTLPRAVLAIAVWVLLGSLACGVLALLSLWYPLVALATLLPLAALSWRLVEDVPVDGIPRRTALAALAAALAIGVWAEATQSEQIVVRRDSASYLQATAELANHHHRLIAIDPATHGGVEPGAEKDLTVSSPAFYEINLAGRTWVQPQFMIGPPAMYSIGYWVGGARGAIVLAPLFGAVGLLAIGLIAGALIGRRWIVPAILLTGACFPMLHTIRTTYSEPVATVPLAAGLLALAVAARHRHARTAYLAGALIAGTVLVRADALREAILLIPVGCLAIGQGHRWGAALLRGTGHALAVTVPLGLLTSTAYLGSIAASLVPLVLGGLLVAGGAALLMRFVRRGWRLPDAASRMLPRLLFGAVIVVGLVLASRPLWMTTRQSAKDPGAMMVARLQARQGLTVDGGRTYAEHTLTWMGWWVGPAALLIALVTLAVLASRAGRAWSLGEDLPAWAGPTLVAAGSTLLTLYRPGITPDHPWADRRLLIALPFAILLVLAAARAVLHEHPERGLRSGDDGRTMSPDRRRQVVAGLMLASLVAPLAWATAPHAIERIESGELDGVRRTCREIGPDDLVLMASERAVNEWTQLVRGMCGARALAPTKALREDPAAFAAVARRVAAEAAQHHQRVVLLSADPDVDLKRLGGTEVGPVRAVHTREDERLLERMPRSTDPLMVAAQLGVVRP